MNFNEFLIANIGLRFQRVMLYLGVFFGRQLTAAEHAFQAAAVLAVGLMSVGYAIAWANWHMSPQVSVTGGIVAFVVGVIGGMGLILRGQRTTGVIALGAGLVLGLTLILQGGVPVGETIITLGGLLGAMFLMLTMAQLAVIGAETAAMAAGVDQVPALSLEFSEHLSGAQVLWILRMFAAVCATLVLMGLYSSMVPVYTSLRAFLGVLLALFFLMFAAFGFASTMVWLPRLQRMSMFAAVAAIILYTLQFVALSAGTSLGQMFNPFGLTFQSSIIRTKAVELANTVGWTSSEAWIDGLLTLGWWVAILVFVGVLVPWLLRATGIIEKPVRAAGSSGSTASAGSAGASAGTVTKFVVGLGVLIVGLAVAFVACSWLIAGVSWMLENARSENNQDTRSSVVQSSRSEVPQSVKAGELPVRWQTLGSFSLKADSDWQETDLQFEPNDCVSFELTGWSGSVNVKFDEKHIPIEVSNGGKIQLIQKGGLKLKIFSIESGKNAGYSVIVRKRVIG